MKRGLRRRQSSAGFTIVETMIVLAVTGILFVAIAISWAGRQHKNEFTTSSNDIRDRMQQVISDVQNGFFPDTAGFTCTKTGSSNLSLTSSSQTQGTNDNCVFLGKVMQFGYKTDPEEYRTFSIAAAREPSDLLDFSTYKGTVIAPSFQNSTNDLPDLTERGTLLYGLTVHAMQAEKSTGSWVNVDAVGFLSRNGTADPTHGGLNNGTQQIDLYAFNGDVNSVNYGAGLTASNSPNSELNKELTSTATGQYYKNVEVRICFQSGGTNQFAILTIGGGNSELVPVLTIAASCATG